MSKPLRIKALYDGKNPRNIFLEAEETGDPDIYQEIRVGAFKSRDCVADILVGLNDRGEVRVLITTEGEGDGDPAIAVYPERSLREAIEMF